MSLPSCRDLSLADLEQRANAARLALAGPYYQNKGSAADYLRATIEALESAIEYAKERDKQMSAMVKRHAGLMAMHESRNT